MIDAKNRAIVWFSCGASSAITALYAVKKFPNCSVVYCDTGGEHPSNREFLLDIEKAPLSRLLYRMEKKGWIERRSDKNDKRIKNLFLSKKIKPLILDMRDMANFTRQQALSGLSEKEQIIFRENLKKIKQTLSTQEF